MPLCAFRPPSLSTVDREHKKEGNNKEAQEVTLDESNSDLPIHGELVTKLFAIINILHILNCFLNRYNKFI